MSLEANPATRVHSHGHSRSHSHAHFHGQPRSAVDDPHHRHPQHLNEFPVEQSQHHAPATSPLWWSAKQRLACAGLLAGALWLVIAWAVA